MSVPNSSPEQRFSDFVDCQCGDDLPGCICQPEEKALRAIMAGCYRPMTPAEREWCMREIIAVEGYRSEDAEGTDADVARTVLNAWKDYCLDKGLL